MTEPQLCNTLALVFVIIIVAFFVGYILGKVG